MPEEQQRSTAQDGGTAARRKMPSQSRADRQAGWLWGLDYHPGGSCPQQMLLATLRGRQATWR